MGQQQLLLLILGGVIVGIAVSIAIVIFQDNAITKNKEAITNDLLQLAVKAQHYYYRPKSMGGGSHSFVGLTADSLGLHKISTIEFSDNSNGKYSIITAGDASHVIFKGVGNVELEDGTFPTLTLTVTPQGQVLSILN
ncbi:MAG: hypothetical protein H3C35_12035 [Bacteroidetes bacterium]|nr:hypothetical protein [Bacteroidota bacterium]